MLGGAGNGIIVTPLRHTERYVVRVTIIYSLLAVIRTVSTFKKFLCHPLNTSLLFTVLRSNHYGITC